MKIKLQALFSGPGAYDLNDESIGIKVKLYENPETNELMETMAERRAHKEYNSYLIYVA